MKLTLISSLTEHKRDVRYFLKLLSEQDNQDFEIILCLNQNKINQGIFEIIEEYLSFFGDRLKFLYNSKRLAFQQNITSAFHISTGEYISISNSDISIKKDYVRKILNLIQKYNTDIIEYKPRIIGSIKWKPLGRIESKKVFKIKEEPQPLAYTFPMIFNKIFKKVLTKKIVKFKPSVSNDSKLSFELNYLLLLEAKTYVYDDNRIQREYFDIKTWINPQNFFASFNSLENVCKHQNRKIMQEFYYFKAYTLQVFLAGFLTTTSMLSITTLLKYKNKFEKRSKRLVNSLDEYLKKMWQTAEYKDFNILNIYMNKKLPEIEFLKSKLVTSKWDKILSSLEE